MSFQQSSLHSLKDSPVKLKEEKDYRLAFGDGHNSTPVVLARSMFPTPFVMLDDAELASHKYVDTPRKPVGKTLPSSGHSEERNVLRALVNKVEVFMREAFSLHLFFNKTRRRIFDQSYFVIREGVKESDQAHLQETPLYVGRRIHLYCDQCRLRDKLSLVAICKPVKVDSAHKKLGVAIEEMYYHSECTLGAANKSQYNTNKWTMANFDLQKVVGDIYEKGIEKIETFEAPRSYFDTTLNAKDKAKIMSNKEVWPTGRMEPRSAKEDNAAVHPSPPGDFINFGTSDYDYDNRKYLMLPCVKEELPVDPVWHKAVIARIGYILCQHLAIEDEFSPFLLDRAKYKRELNRKVKETKEAGNRWVVNGNCHLSLQEVSLLFGGTEVRVVGDLPVHQVMHTDCVGFNKFQANDNLTGKVYPGSFLFPLQSKRSIYVQNSNNVLTALKNQMLVFRGDLRHGGLTRRETTWDVSVHGHIDSTHHPRTRGLLAVDKAREGYLPFQHLLLTQPKDFMDYFIHETKWMATVVERATQLTPIFKGYEKDKNKTLRGKARQTTKLLNDLGKCEEFNVNVETMNEEAANNVETAIGVKNSSDEDDGSHEDKKRKIQALYANDQNAGSLSRAHLSHLRVHQDRRFGYDLPEGKKKEALAYDLVSNSFDYHDPDTDIPVDYPPPAEGYFSQSPKYDVKRAGFDKYIGALMDYDLKVMFGLKNPPFGYVLSKELIALKQLSKLEAEHRYHPYFRFIPVMADIIPAAPPPIMEHSKCKTNVMHLRYEIDSLEQGGGLCEWNYEPKCSTTRCLCACPNTCKPPFQFARSLPKTAVEGRMKPPHHLFSILKTDLQGKIEVICKKDTRKSRENVIDTLMQHEKVPSRIEIEKRVDLIIQREFRRQMNLYSDSDYFKLRSEAIDHVMQEIRKEYSFDRHTFLTED
jgi:hypothetical protein